MINPFPKIFKIGTTFIKDILKDDVYVQEKTDGSFFAFGKINGELQMRSKGAELFVAHPEKMFSKAIHYVDSISHKLPDDLIFFCEYLGSPKHNTLKYDRVPSNHLILFDVMDLSENFRVELLEHYAEFLEIERVPILFKGRVGSVQELHDLLNTESVLGGGKIEGVVVKNYFRKFLFGSLPMPLMAGKLVSEAFQEVHSKRWGAEETGKSRMEVFFGNFKTEARWEKAVQHLRDLGQLDQAPKDIGCLIKEIHRDIETEEIENVKNFLWGEFRGELMRRSTGGFPEWYKNSLEES